MRKSKEKSGGFRSQGNAEQVEFAENSPLSVSAKSEIILSFKSNSPSENLPPCVSIQFLVRRKSQS